MKYIILIILALMTHSCQDKPKIKQNRTSVQKRISAAMVKVRDVRSFNADSMMTVVDALEPKSVGLNPEYKAMCKIIRGACHFNRSSYELGVREFEKAIPLVGDPKADTLKAFAYTGIGNSHKYSGEYPKAQQFFYRALKIFERLGGKPNISNMYANLGEMYLLKGDTKQAKENLVIALKTLADDKASNGYLKAAHSLANVYGMNGEYDKALALDAEGIRVSDSLKSTVLKAPFLDNKANCFMYSNQLDSAEFYFKECLKLDILNRNTKQIADTYSNLGALAGMKNDFVQAEALLQKSIGMLKTIGQLHNLSKSYKLLADVYVKQGDYKKAYHADREYLEQYKRMINEKKEASLAEFRVLHETDRNEKLLAENRLELLEKESDVKQRNSLLVLMGLLAAFIGFVGFFIARQHKMRHTQLTQEHQLKSAIDKIETQNKLQKQRLEISRDLHDNIGAQLTFIISSVDNLKYAFDLKDTKLDQKLNGISTFARETIVELRDTIWAMNNNSLGFEDLRARIMNFIEKARESHENVQFKFHVDPQLSDTRMSSLVGMNIYRAIQEAVNNGLKYSNGDEIAIQIDDIDGKVRVVISDNGIGFNSDEVQKGNGLHNMQKRMSELNGTFSLITSQGKGVKILLELPTTLLTKGAA